MKPTLFLLPLLGSLALAEPVLDSWITQSSGQYARIYRDNADAAARSPVTVWSRGAGTQSAPTYAGIHEISATATDVYVRTTGLAFHIMGPWYGGNGSLFPNYPSNRAATFRLPRTPDVSISPKSPTGLGSVGVFVDGVSMFDSRDAFSYDTSAGQDETPGGGGGVVGDDIWNRDAYINESDTFDPAFAHQAGNNHHYHANPPGLRHVLGDSVAYDASTHTYTESFNGGHSPILGWAIDGLPLYGPYGYSDPLNPASGVRRMISGYQKRDGTNGSTNLNTTGRTTLPQWCIRNGRAPISGASQNGPAVGPDYTLGHYLEDYAYKGDLGMTPGTDFDLNEYNVRWCVTPDFPGGTWAYFTNIEADGTPVFPYNLARYYFGNPTGDGVNDVPAGAETLWEGGPEKALETPTLGVDSGSGNVTLVWSSVEGGNYVVHRSEDLGAGGWEPIVRGTGGGASTMAADPGRAQASSRQFYQVEFESVEPFDDAGFEYDNSIIAQPTNHNVLLLILDDWGIDSSGLYNTPGAGIQLAEMPHLETLANAGLLFTRGYSQPICSPTRATILTGRQPYQHGVGNPQGNNTLPASELTFPEIMTTEASAYGLASFGKWHLGSGNTGPFDTGGWPNFSGTTGGGVPDYASWTRVKIENGTLVDSGTNVTSLVPGTYSSPYATSVQVDEAVSFISSRGSDPWVVWMGFNAPHDPFHDPAPYVTPTGGYSTGGTTDKDHYIRMLEALDHEIGRLLQSVDLATTNVIVVGDNGTPGQVDQAPVGGLAGAKGSLNEGGIHVPFFAAGPDVIQTGTTDKLVHVVDLFATILDLTGVNVAAATDGIEIHSRSLLPIFWGTDMEDRCIVSEKFGLNAATDGRSLIMDDWPDYKLVSIQDVTDPTDTPSYQMYQLGPDGVETSTLTTPPAPGDAWEAAYNALVAKDEAMTAVVSQVVRVDIDLPTNAPPLVNANNGNIIRPMNITIGGVAATWDTGDITVNNVTSSAARVDEGDGPDPFSVVAEFDVTNSGLTSGQSYTMIVTFPGGGGRDFTATNTFLMP